MAVSLDQFLAQVSNAGLLSPERAAALIERANADPRLTVETIAGELVDQGRLTEYQTRQFLTGKGRGLVLGNYVILERLGQGGMGTVYKARHRRMDRLVALKVLKPDIVKTPELLARFQREVKAAARLEHPNIVAAYDADEARGTHFFVMQYIDGHDLATLLKTRGPLDLATAVGCVMQAARGLEYAHRNGVIHRDIKPANLLLDRHGVLKILDMGLARIDGEVSDQHDLTTTGAVMGTVDYMAPEQAMSTRDADARSDIYSLGATLWQLLAGRPMFSGDSLMARLIAHREAPIPSLRQVLSDRPDPIRGEALTDHEVLEAVFRKMVAKRPADRYQTMGEVLAALSIFGAGDGESKHGRSDHAASDSRITRLAEGLSGRATVTTPAADGTPATALQTPASVRQLSSVTVETGLSELRTATVLPRVSSHRLNPQHAAGWWRTRWVYVVAAGLALCVALSLRIPRSPVTAPSDAPGVSVPVARQTPDPEATSVSNPTSPHTATTDPVPMGNPILPERPSWPFDPRDGKTYVWSPPEPVPLNIPNIDLTFQYLWGLGGDELTLHYCSTDSLHVEEVRRAERSAAFGPRQLLSEFGPMMTWGTISANGLAAAFVRQKSEAASEIWLARRADLSEPFGFLERAPEPVNVPEGNTIHPALSPDGRVLVTTCVRFGSPDGDVHLFHREGLDQPFVYHRRLQRPVNSPYWDMPFVVSDDRCFLIAARQWTTEDQRVIREARYYTRATAYEVFGEGRPLDLPLGAGKHSDQNASYRLSADGLALYFEAYTPKERSHYPRLMVCRRVPQTDVPTPVLERVDTAPTTLSATIPDPDDSTNAARFAQDWGPPENLGPGINTKFHDEYPMLSRDGQTLWFSGGGRLVTARRDMTTGLFQLGPELPGPVNLGTAWDSESRFSADELTLVFSSERGAKGANIDLWMATRPDVASEFGMPVRLPDDVNSAQTDLAPTFTPDGLTLYFASERPTERGSRQLYQATRASLGEPFGNVTLLPPEINVSETVTAPFVSADGLTLLFASLPPVTRARRSLDLYYASRDKPTDPFGPAERFANVVNSPQEDNGPSLSPDGQTLFFFSYRAGGHGEADLYQSRRLNRSRKTP